MHDNLICYIKTHEIDKDIIVKWKRCPLTFLIPLLLCGSINLCNCEFASTMLYHTL